jgi:hypothetical protein
LSSCSKDQGSIAPAPSNGGVPQLISSLEDVNAEFGIAEGSDLANDGKSFKIRWWKIVLADAKGFLTSGTIVGAGIASLDYILENGMVIPSGNPGDPFVQLAYKEITPQNPNNPFECMGVGHNASLEAMFNNYGAITNKDGSLNYVAIWNGGHDVGCPAAGCFPSGLCICSGWGPWMKTQTSDDLEEAVENSKRTLSELAKMKVISAMERDVALLYKKGTKKLADIDDFYSYTEAFENNIASDIDLSNDSKETLLGFLSVAKHSRTYWTNKKFGK